MCISSRLLCNNKGIKIFGSIKDSSAKNNLTSAFWYCDISTMNNNSYDILSLITAGIF